MGTISEQVGEIWFDAKLDDKGLVAETKAAAKAASREADVQFSDDPNFSGLGKAAKEESTRVSKSPSSKVVFHDDADFADLVVKARAAAKAASEAAKVRFTLDQKGFTFDASGILRNAQGAEASLEELGQALTDTAAQGKSAFGGLSAAAIGGGIAVAQGIAVAIPVVTALGSAIVALAGQVAVAAGGLAFGLVGSLAAVGVAAGAVMVGIQGLPEAFKAVGKAQAEMAANGEVSKKTLEAQKQALSNLAPAAADFVTAVTSVSGAWRDMAKSVQQQLFVGLGDDLKGLTANLLPALQSGLGAVAAAVNTVAQGFLEWAGSAEGAATISAILHGLAPVITSLAAAAGSFGGAFLTLFQGALPFIQQFATAIAGVGASFATWATGFVASGGLTDFLAKAWDAGTKLWDILMNVGSIIGSLFAGSGDLGSGLLSSIEDITGALADFLGSAEGQQQLNTFFASMGTVLGTVKDAVVALWPVFQSLFIGIMAAWPSVQKLVDGFAALTPILAPLAAGLAFMLVSGISPLLSLIGQFSGVFSTAASAVASFLGAIFSGFVGLISGIVSLGATLYQALVQPWIDLFNFLIGNSLIPDLVTGIITWFATLPGAIIGAIGDLAGAFATWVGGVVGIVAGVIASVVAAFSGLASRAISAAGSLLSSFGSWVASIPGRAAALVSSIVSAFVGLAGRIIGAAGNLASQAASWFMGMVTAAAKIPGQIVSYFVGLAGRIMDAVGTLSFGGILGAASGGIAGAAHGAIAGASNGVYMTRGPEVRLIGEAGPEAVVPLRSNQTLDPSVEALLQQVAASRGMTDEQQRPIAPITVMLPTGDPEAAAMAIWNRLVFENAA